MAGSCNASDHILYYYSTQSLLLDDRTAQGCDESFCHLAYVYGEQARCSGNTCLWQHGAFRSDVPHPPTRRLPLPPIWAPLKTDGKDGDVGQLDMKTVVTRLRESWQKIGALDDQCWKGELTSDGLVAMQTERQRFRRLIHHWSKLLRDAG